MRPEQKEEFKKNVGMMFSEMQRKLKLKRVPKLILVEDKNNANKQLGGTGSYDKKSDTIRVYITERHPKDILRTIAHEVIHHWQNENNKLNSPNDNVKEADPQYAQNDPVLREAEKQAYLLGSVMFRDWEDQFKNKLPRLKTENILKKKIILEGPERMLGVSWANEECIGPFIIFKSDGRINYVIGDNNEGRVFLNGDSVLSYKPLRLGNMTHGVLLDSLEKEMGIRLTRFGYDSEIHGRLWKLNDGKAYIGLWNEVDTIKKFGANNALSIMKDIIQKFTNIRDESKIFIQPYDDDEADTDMDGIYARLYSPDQFEKLFSSKSKTTSTSGERKEMLKKLHLMQAGEKAMVLKQLGASGKIGDMPDWKKRAMLGIDEKMV